jgi:alpha-L-rhamnosidase
MPANGTLPGIVPTGGWGYGVGPAWDSALFLIPWYLYLYAGDTRILTDSYEHFTRYLDWLDAQNYMSSPPAGWLGDWVNPGDSTPGSVTHAGYHAVDARITALTAELLGNTADAAAYQAMADQVKSDFQAEFFDAGSAQVATDSQTALAAALYQDLLEAADRPRVVERLLSKIAEKNDHLDTGVLGIKYLPYVLTESGNAETFFTIATQTTQPSWGWWRAQGATTFWETWGAGGSHNHIFLGDISAWFYRALAGINPDPAAPGFAHVIIRPEVVGDLTFARGETRTLRGRIASGWERQGNAVTLSGTIPVNSTATVIVPVADPAQVTSADGATAIAPVGGRPAFSIGSGTYLFELNLP